MYCTYVGMPKLLFMRGYNILVYTKYIYNPVYNYIYIFDSIFMLKINYS